MKKSNIIIAACLFSFSVFGQEGEPSKKVLQAFGYSAFTDIIGGPRIVQTYWDPQMQTYNSVTGGSTYGGYRNIVTQASGFSIVTLLYRFRYNVLEPNDNLSVGLSATPAFAFAVDPVHGGGFLNLPIQAELGFGAGSTYNASSDKGGYVGVGIEMNKFPLVDLSGNNYDDPTDYGYTIRPKTFWIQPVISAGFRYWNPRNKMKEVNLKFGFGAQSDRVTYSTQNDYVNFPVLTFRLSWITFLNY